MTVRVNIDNMKPYIIILMCILLISCTKTPWCEEAKVGVITVVNETGKPLWVDLVWEGSDNKSILISEGWLDFYDVPEGDVHIYVSHDRVNYGRFKVGLKACDHVFYPIVEFETFIRP